MRIRTIKPEFWLHEGLCGCTEFARLMAIALLNWADDHGYFMAHPSLLRGSLFPFLDDSKKIPGTLQELSRVGWIELGTDNQGRPVGRVINFNKHQRVDKPQASKIKDFFTFQDHSKNVPGTFLDDSKEEWNGMEWNKERKGTPLPPKGAEWLPTPEQLEVASWFGRRQTTRWQDDELKAWRKLTPEIISEGLEVLAGPYKAKAPYVKTKIITLLNSWTGEVDRWRSWTPQKRSNVSTAGMSETDTPWFEDQPEQKTT
jgi:hypothetical protein